MRIHSDNVIHNSIETKIESEVKSMCICKSKTKKLADKINFVSN